MKLKHKKFLLIILLYFFSFGYSGANESQFEFIKIVNEYKKKYSPSDNDLKVNKLLINRDNEICQKIPLEVNRWSGKIKSISTNMEGKGILELIIGKSIGIQTWNNAFSDIFDNTLIEVNSNVYDQLIEMKKNQIIYFSGNFLANSAGCFSTQNLTKKSQLAKPEFSFQFSDIKLK